MDNLSSDELVRLYMAPIPSLPGHRTLHLEKYFDSLKVQEKYLYVVLPALAAGDPGEMDPLFRYLSTCLVPMVVASTEAYTKNVLQLASKNGIKIRGAKPHPESWIGTLSAAGCRFDPHTIAYMVWLWGLRHDLIHEGGIVSAEYAAKRPAIGIGQVGGPSRLYLPALRGCFTAAFAFAWAIDAFFFERIIAPNPRRHGPPYLS